MEKAEFEGQQFLGAGSGTQEQDLVATLLGSVFVLSQDRIPGCQSLGLPGLKVG